MLAVLAERRSHGRFANSATPIDAGVSSVLVESRAHLHSDACTMSDASAHLAGTAMTATDSMQAYTVSPTLLDQQDAERAANTREKSKLRRAWPWQSRRRVSG